MGGGGKSSEPAPVPAGPTAFELEAQRQAEEAAAEASRVAAEESTTKQLFMERSDQVSSATRTVDEALAAEASRASVLGLEHNVPEELRAERISNQLSGLRTEQQDLELLDLLGKNSKFGKSLGFTGEFDTALGKVPSGATSATSSDLGRKTILNPQGIEDDAETLGGATILG